VRRAQGKTGRQNRAAGGGRRGNQKKTAIRSEVWNQQRAAGEPGVAAGNATRGGAR